MMDLTEGTKLTAKTDLTEKTGLTERFFLKNRTKILQRMLFYDKFCAVANNKIFILKYQNTKHN